MEEIILLRTLDWEELKKVIADEIRGNLTSNTKRFLKSAEVREMFGGISAAKLQSLRVSPLARDSQKNYVATAVRLLSISRLEHNRARL